MESLSKRRPSDQAYLDIDTAAKQRCELFFQERPGVLQEREQMKEKVVEEFRRIMEERCTHPVLDNQYNPTERMLVQDLVEGKKITVGLASEFTGLLTRIGQSYRLTVDEIDELQHELFEFRSDTKS